MTTRAEFKAVEAARLERLKQMATLHALAKGDSFVAAFVDMTPAQVLAYVDANVTDLASARALIRKMCLMLLVLAKKEFKD